MIVEARLTEERLRPALREVLRLRFGPALCALSRDRRYSIDLDR